MPRRRLIVPLVRKTLKLHQDRISLDITNVPYPVTAGASTEALPTGNPNIRFRIPSALALHSGSNSRMPVTGTVLDPNI